MITIQYKMNDEVLTTSKTNQHLMILKEQIDHRVRIKIKPLTDVVLLKAKITYDFPFSKHCKLFLNGYQSWTDTKEFYFEESFKIASRARRFLKGKNDFKKTKDFLLNQFAFDRYGDLLFYPYDENKLHGYDIFYVKGETEFFSFNLNHENIYLIYEVEKKTKQIHLLADIQNFALKKDIEFVLFDYVVYDQVVEGMSAFKENYQRKDKTKILGYTSWYNYYQNINEEIILRDLDSLDDRFNLFQIDDGYETFVGDWLDIDPIKFPHGLKTIVNRIHQKGYQAGIWLAPFVAEEKSKLFREHQELFKKDEDGNCIKCGGNWSGFYVLDIENPKACEYIQKYLKFYMDCGFDFFKLDFLYAISLPKYDYQTRAMITNKGYLLLRETLKDKTILGCGALIFSSSKYFDYLRVGPDVSLKFDDVWYMRFAHRERISTKVTLQNTIYRSFFNQHLFLNDPDVFLLRSDHISLSFKQKEALLMINALFGNVLMTSDNIKNYNDEAKVLLEKALDLFYHASDVSFFRNEQEIVITYQLKQQKHHFTYQTNKGVIVYERQN